MRDQIVKIDYSPLKTHGRWIGDQIRELFDSFLASEQVTALADKHGLGRFFVSSVSYIESDEEGRIPGLRLQSFRISVVSLESEDSNE